MRALRWTGASLLGLLGGVLALVGVLLCVTLVLLPLGIPVLFLSRRLFRTAGQLVVPRAVRHPVDEVSGKASKATKALRKRASKAPVPVPVPRRRSRLSRLGHKLHLA